MSVEREVPGPLGTRFFSIRHVVETGSTNADLLERAAAGDPDGIVLVADHQRSGRGRQARPWHDQPGNSMLMSVLLRPDPSLLSLMPLLAGLAMTDGIHQLLDLAGDAQGPLALKWPNDVLVPHLGERKLAGILAEVRVDGGRPAVVVGMGCNLRWSAVAAQPEIAQRAATVEEVAGHPMDRWAVVRAVLRALDGWLVRADEEGPDVLLDHYRQRCLTIGRAVRLVTPTEVVEGRARAVADNGGLVVSTADRQLTLMAGDVHHI